MQRKVHLRPSKEANANGKLWLLEKCVYGLADASLKWYEKVKKTLNECGGIESKVDPAVFYWYNSNGLAGVLAVHVDDFLWAGTNLFETEIISKNKREIQYFKRVNKLLRKVRNDPVSLHFKELGEHVELLLYTDASFGNLPDGGSQGGFVIMLLGENGKINSVTWQSKKIRRVVRSTLASEALALADGIDCATSLATLYNELVFNKCTTEGGITVRCVIDNKDLFEAVHSKKNVSEKRLRLEISCIKEMIQKGELTVHWIETKEQIANVLTKHGASAQNLFYCFETGLVNTVFIALN
ncbi:Hypothetical predicted protein [Mytilus galloprovincialis]|uniref:Reverse transcriptase Ty1/copia-type domain-containing protein n=1 Tax=Mytilus galloprovincialis TaxID=29158 RepID=A0A8B6FPN9_MYTGA|nr:Hypothetical predicted protein [Mytilus galloprovincialis]